MKQDCPFCRIIVGADPGDIVAEMAHSIVMTPIRPIVPGHVLVIPTTHVTTALTDPEVTAATMRDAANWAHGRLANCNIFANVGALGGQTVFHLHFHVVPRASDDGLRMIWQGSEHASV